MNVNVKFVVRGLLIALPAVLIFTVVGINLAIARTPMGQPPGQLPPLPTILAPRGEMPSGPVGLEMWALYRGEAYVLSGSGFFIKLNNGEIVGVTAAHSVSIGDPGRPLERIAFSVTGQTDPVAECDRLRGVPGQLSTEDLSKDYVLLQVDQPIAPELVLIPDSRGAPQRGERVSLYAGVGDDEGRQRVLSGTVLSVSETAVWVLMDEDTFNPSMMSGSPIISQYTGRVVGMAIAATLREYRFFPRYYRVLIGMHPIASIVRLAESADEFPKISDD